MENKNDWVVKLPYYPSADISQLSVKQLIVSKFQIKIFLIDEILP